MYELKTEDGGVFQSENQPLLANGFEGSHKLISNLFEHRDDSLLNSTIRMNQRLLLDYSWPVQWYAMTGIYSVSFSNIVKKFAGVLLIAASFDLPTDELLVDLQRVGGCIWMICRAVDRSVWHGKY